MSNKPKRLIISNIPGVVPQGKFHKAFSEKAKQARTIGIDATKPPGFAEFVEALWGDEAAFKNNSKIIESVTEGGTLTPYYNACYRPEYTRSKRLACLPMMADWVTENGFPIRVYSEGKIRKLQTWEQIEEWVRTGKVKA